MAIVLAGHAGHDREITVTLDEYGYGYRYDLGRNLESIPRHVEDEFVAALPAAWKIENRGTRLEVHPSGHFAGGYERADVEAVLAALVELGYELDDRTGEAP